MSIADVAHAIAKAMNFQGKLVFDTTKSDGQFKKTASNAKLRTYLPEFQFIPFQEGVDKSVEWFEANYDTCRKGH